MERFSVPLWHVLLATPRGQVAWDGLMGVTRIDSEPTRVIGHYAIAAGDRYLVGHILYVSIAEAIWRNRGKHKQLTVLHFTSTSEDRLLLAQIKVEECKDWEEDPYSYYDGWTTGFY